MSLQPPYDMLQSLRTMLRKLEADPAPSRSLLELRRLLIARIAQMEDGQRQFAQFFASVQFPSDHASNKTT